MTMIIKHPAWMDEMPHVFSALAFAQGAHTGQVRKYTGEAYINHPLEVCTILYDAGVRCQDTLAAALLHDVVEDCGVTFTEVGRQFGDATRNLVFWLTDVVTKAQGNRETRKALEAQKIGFAPLGAQLAKLADLISNTNSIVENDPDFAVVYLREKERTISAMAASVRKDPIGRALHDRAIKNVYTPS